MIPVGLLLVTNGTVPVTQKERQVAAARPYGMNS